MQVSVEESKTVEISKLQKTLALLSAELDDAKLAITNECNKNAMLRGQLASFENEKANLVKDLARMEEVIKENLCLKVICSLLNWYSL